MSENITENKLKERIKEISCLYEVYKIIAQDSGLGNDILKEISFLIKKAWKYSEDAIVELKIADLLVTTSPVPNENIYQSCEIKIYNEVAGYVRVYYDSYMYAPNHFLKEEQQLLDAVSLIIGSYVEKQYILSKKELLKKSIEVKNRLSILGEITAGVAHELNTPLNNILGFAELIRLNNTDIAISEDLLTIINLAEYSKEIIKKIMYFSSKTPMTLESSEIKPIITDALLFLRQSFQKKEIKCDFECSDDKVRAMVDSVQLTQVFFNIIVNAIYASPNKSILKINVYNDTENLVIAIKDNGSGIPDFIKGKIFDPFFTTKPIREGYGHGLSIVNEIIKHHNGKIDVTKNSPEGTIFLITLPVCR